MASFRVGPVGFIDDRDLAPTCVCIGMLLKLYLFTLSGQNRWFMNKPIFLSIFIQFYD
jgi:hypothetical protein